MGLRTFSKAPFHFIPCQNCIPKANIQQQISKNSNSSFKIYFTVFGSNFITIIKNSFVVSVLRRDEVGGHIPSSLVEEELTQCIVSHAIWKRMFGECKPVPCSWCWEISGAMIFLRTCWILRPI